jgi:hypothetical protein
MTEPGIFEPLLKEETGEEFITITLTSPLNKHGASGLFGNEVKGLPKRKNGSFLKKLNSPFKKSLNSICISSRTRLSKKTPKTQTSPIKLPMNAPYKSPMEFFLPNLRVQMKK